MWYSFLARRARPVIVVTALVVCAFGVTAHDALGATAGPAPAALSGNDWTAATLPPDMVLGAGTSSPVAPVSCAPGTGFCLAVVSDSAEIDPVSFTEDPADVVTTDGGNTWQAYTNMPFGLQDLSCVSTEICWGVTSGMYYPQAAETTDGGETWTALGSAALAPGDNAAWVPEAIDCVSAATCWVAGQTDYPVHPMMAETTDGGATWTTFTNLPSRPQTDPNGTYGLYSLSCVSALSCVAAGGLNLDDGLSEVISTTDGGATWSWSADPVLSGVQTLWGLSCVPVPGSLPTCYAAGGASGTAGPVVLKSADGGATWSGDETYDDTGWMSSVSCADASHCWTAGGGTTVSLLGTSDAASSWHEVTADTTNEEGNVSCPMVSLCVAATDNALWVTTDDGGLSAAAREAAAAQAPAVRALPAVSPAQVAARTGRPVVVTGQYRGTGSPATAKVTVTPAHGRRISTIVPIGLNHFYSVRIGKLAAGSTTVTFAVKGVKNQLITVHGYPDAAPVITRLSVQAGPNAGGNQITITGRGFSGATRVVFTTQHERRVVTRFRLISGTKISVAAPAGTAAGYLSVVTAHGGPSPLTGAAGYNYLPVPAITAMTPASGQAGTVVTITGTALAYVQSVWFGTARATRIARLSARELQVTAPGGTGDVTVKVVTAGGTALANQPFSY
jgi:hypothetical protein